MLKNKTTLAANAKNKDIEIFTQPEDKCKNPRLNKQIFVISICKITLFGCILNHRLRGTCRCTC